MSIPKLDEKKLRIEIKALAIKKMKIKIKIFCFRDIQTRPSNLSETNFTTSLEFIISKISNKY